MITFRKLDIIRVVISFSLLVLNVFIVTPVLAAAQIDSGLIQKHVRGQALRPANEDDSNTIASIFVPNLFFYSVVQQPENDPGFVSPLENVITEFGLPQNYGNIGLLAHNYLAGETFEGLSIGQEIYLFYEDGHADRYTVSQIFRFRAFEPNDTNSRFEDLSTGETLSASEVFTEMYAGEAHLTLQTCIYANGDYSWGRLFVIALPDAS